ncbi:MAG: recombination factor protein RarA, partial [Gemmatimonadota bacterium]
DPDALRLAVAARDAYHFLGSPEGELALAEAALYLATAPKSNRAYVALGRAMRAAKETPAAPVPLHIRNAPTKLMKELGYGRDYRYAFESEEHYIPQEYLPDAVRGQRYYEPSRFGFEKRIAERMEWWDARRREAEGTSEPPGEYKQSENPEPGEDGT